MAKKTDKLAKRIDQIVAHADRPLRKNFHIDQATKSVDDVARTVRFTITTGSVDRDNDTIAPGGWETSGFMKNPSVLWAHDYSALPVAKAVELTVKANGLESLAQFPPKGTYPFADTVFELIKFGALNATSVGFRPLEYTRDEERGGINFVRQELLEYSIVPVPANGEALIAARAAGAKTGLLRKWAKAVLEKDAGMSCPACGEDVGPNDDACANCGGDLKAAKDNADGANGSQTCPQCHVGSAQFDGTRCLACGYAGQPTAAATDAGEKDEAGKNVPPSNGGATGSLCPACGAELASDGDGDGADMCPACGWRSPVAEPMTQPYRTALGEVVKAAVLAALQPAPGLAAEMTPFEYVERAVEVALAGVVKRGRVLSAANESKLRAAREALDAVLAKLEQQPEVDDDGADKAFLAILPEATDGPVLRLADDEGADMRAAVDAALREVIREIPIASLVAESVQVAIARARGRVD